MENNILEDYLAAKLTIKELKLKYNLKSKDLAEILINNRVKILEYNKKNGI